MLSQTQFYEWFNEECDAIRTELDKCTTEAGRDDCLDLLSSLANACKNNRHSLTVHDQQIYSQKIDTIRDEIQKRQFGKKKLLFGNRPRGSFFKKGTPSGSSTQSQDLPVSDVPNSRGHKNELITSHNTDSISYDGIESCVLVNYEDLGSVKLNNIKKSLVYLPRVNGPVHVSNATNCVLITRCHQFRVHASSELDIYIGCTQPIIEECSKLRFAAFPASMDLNNPSQLRRNWDSIVDFNWLSAATQSPNWQVLEDSGNFAQFSHLLDDNSALQDLDLRHVLHPLTMER